MCSSDLLVSEILDAAKPPIRNPNWFDRLDDDQRSVVLEVRSGWQATRNVTNVSAMEVARKMIERLTPIGYGLPQTKEIARWLTKRT